jgi:serine/threonine protein kinase
MAMNLLGQGKYRVLREIGRGAMGTVYEAEHTLSHKRFAIKCLRPERGRSMQAVERMVGEARVSAHVDHPNAVAVYDVVQEGDTAYLVMELLQGETLEAAFARGRMEPHLLIALLIPAMQAVAAAHRSKIVHRDIKPENIFLARSTERAEPVTKVLDFGVSKFLAADESLALTGTGAVIGTPLYMAYEQLSGQSDVDERVDVYAFGAVLYEGLTGSVPHPATLLTELILSHVAGPPKAPAALCPSLPMSLSRLLLWALARERAERIGSLEEFIREIEPFASFNSYRAQVFSESESDADCQPAAPGPPPSSATEARQSASLSAWPVRKKEWPGYFAVASISAICFALLWKGSNPLSLVEAEPARDGGATSPMPPPAAPSGTSESNPALDEAPLPVPGSPGAKVEGASAEASRKPSAKRREVRRKQVDPRSPPVPQVKEDTREHRAADLARLRAQLVACGDLETDWLRAICRDKHRRAIVEREDDHALANSLSQP